MSDDDDLFSIGSVVEETVNWDDDEDTTTSATLKKPKICKTKKEGQKMHKILTKRQKRIVMTKKAVAFIKKDSAGRTAERKQLRADKLRRVADLKRARVDKEDSIGGVAKKLRASRREGRTDDSLLHLIGFDNIEKTLDSRVKKAAAAKKDQDPGLIIERDVISVKTRFIPFGSNKLREDTIGFYSTATDLCCCWCTEQINAVPIPYPHKYNSRTQEFAVCKQFCTFNCMLAFARSTGRLTGTPRMMMKAVYGIPFGKEIEPAKSPMLLKKFGGPFSHEEFKATSFLGIKGNPIALPLIPFSAGIEEIEKVTTRIIERGTKEEVDKIISESTRLAFGIKPIMLQNNVRQKSDMQRSSFTEMMSMKQQIEASDQRLRLQMSSTSPTGKKKTGKRTIMDFLKTKG
jgi:hypothetical protein